MPPLRVWQLCASVVGHLPMDYGKTWAGVSAPRWLYVSTRWIRAAHFKIPHLGMYAT